MWHTIIYTQGNIHAISLSGTLPKIFRGHSPLSQDFLERPKQSVPPCWAGCSMTLFFFPWPHEALQVPHWPHLQLMGQCFRLHPLTELPQQSLPPCWACCSMTLFWFPGPHVVLQVPHWPHLQSMGHGVRLHSWIACPGHSVPPCWAGCSMTLFWFPGPHVVLQVPHWPHLQSMGHGVVLLHLRVESPMQSSPSPNASMKPLAYSKKNMIRKIFITTLKLILCRELRKK